MTTARDSNVTNHSRPIYKYSNNDIPPYVVYVYSDRSFALHFSVLSRIISEC